MAVAAFASDGGTSSFDDPVVVTLRSGAAACSAGDAVIVFVGQDATGTWTWPSPWAELFDETFTGGIWTCGWMKAVGGETTVSVDPSLTERWAAISVHVPAAEWHGTTAPEFSATATGSSTTPNAATCTPSWGTDGGVQTLYISACAADDSAAPFPITGWPTNYSLIQTQAGGDAQTSAVDVAVAARLVSAASDDAAAFTMTSTETWAARTVALRGPAAAAGDTPFPYVGAGYYG